MSISLIKALDLCGGPKFSLFVSCHISHWSKGLVGVTPRDQRVTLQMLTEAHSQALDYIYLYSPLRQQQTKMGVKDIIGSLHVKNLILILNNVHCGSFFLFL